MFPLFLGKSSDVSVVIAKIFLGVFPKSRGKGDKRKMGRVVSFLVVWFDFR